MFFMLIFHPWSKILMVICKIFKDARAGSRGRNVLDQPSSNEGSHNRCFVSRVDVLQGACVAFFSYLFCASFNKNPLFFGRGGNMYLGSRGRTWLAVLGIHEARGPILDHIVNSLKMKSQLACDFFFFTPLRFDFIYLFLKRRNLLKQNTTQTSDGLVT